MEFDFVHVMAPPDGPNRDNEEGALSKETRRIVEEWLEQMENEPNVLVPKWEQLIVLADSIAEEDEELTTVFVDDEDDSPSLEEAQAFLGDSYVQLVRTQSGAQLLMDEDGLSKGLRVNPVASYLYGGKIVGKVIVLQGDAQWT